MSDAEKIGLSLYLIGQYGGIDGEHHKTWVIDQVLRTLLGRDAAAYERWIADHKEGEDGPETYGWNVGIPP